MSVRFSGTESLTRSVNVPLETSFSILGWLRIVTDTDAFALIAAIHAAEYAADLSLYLGADGVTLTMYGMGMSASGSIVLTAGVDYAWFFKSSGPTSVSYGTRAAGVNSWTTQSDSVDRTSFLFTEDTIRFGNSPFTEPFNGRMWNIKVWDAALTDDQLLAESYYARVLFPTSLNFHWRLRNTFDTVDRSGNGRDATVTGSLSSEREYAPWSPRPTLMQFVAPQVVAAPFVRLLPQLNRRYSGRRMRRA